MGNGMNPQGGAKRAVVRKPVALYVEKVYEEGNFTLLGIAT